MRFICVVFIINVFAFQLCTVAPLLLHSSKVPAVSNSGSVNDGFGLWAIGVEADRGFAPMICNEHKDFKAKIALGRKSGFVTFVKTKVKT